MSGDLDLLYSDVEEALRASLRKLLTTTCRPADLIALPDGGGAAVAGLWRSMAGELGLAGLLIPEELGGAGGSAREAAVVMEELGRFVAPAPFLTSAVLAVSALLRVEPTPAGPLAALASGERTAALLLGLHNDATRLDVRVRVTSDGTLRGRVTSVAGVLEADTFVVPAIGIDGIELHLVSAGAPGVTVDPVSSLDTTRPVADVELDGVASEAVFAQGAEAALTAALDLGAALLASEQLGVAQWCLETTVDYLKQRRQFARPVGGFQAIKHRLADLWEQVESARAAARHAAATAAADDPERTLAACVAQAFCADVAVRAAEECVQLHGGIGMTWEYPAHLYLKRAKADQIALGTPGTHRSRVGDLVDLPE